jgi:hypothetical protein
MSWDALNTDDGLRIEADIENGNHLAHTNLVFAFNLGLLTEKGWLSHKAINLLDLISTIELKKKKERKLMVAIMPNTSLDKGFQLFSNPDGPGKPEKIRLYLFYGERGTEANTILVFHNVDLESKKPIRFHKSLPVAMNHYTFKWGGDVDIVGQRA